MGKCVRYKLIFCSIAKALKMSHSPHITNAHTLKYKNVTSLYYSTIMVIMVPAHAESTHTHTPIKAVMNC